MHKTVYIKVNLNTEIFYNVAKISSTTKALKIKKVSEGFLTV